LQVNIHFAAFFENYKIIIISLWNLLIFQKLLHRFHKIHLIFDKFHSMKLNFSEFNQN